MKKFCNGKEIKLTEEEVAEYEKQKAEQEEQDRLNPPEPTPEERLTKLESENAELRQALEILLGGGKAAQK